MSRPDRKKLKAFAAPPPGLPMPNHPLIDVEASALVDYVRDPDRGPRRFAIKSKGAFYRAFFAAFEVAYALAHGFDDSLFVSELARAARELGYKAPDPVRSVLALTFDYLAEAEGAAANDPEAKGRARKSALSRLSRDALAIDHLLQLDVSPAQARELLKKPGQGVDAWSRGATGSKGAERNRTPPARPSLPVRRVTAKDDLSKLRLCLCELEERKGSPVATQVLSIGHGARLKAPRKKLKALIRERLRGEAERPSGSRKAARRSKGGRP